MKIFSFSLLLMCFNISIGQHDSFSSVVDSLSNIYSFNCSNALNEIKSNCFFESPAGSVRKKQIKNSDVNPYEEFDFIKYTLSQDISNPFRLDYQFKECSKTCNASAVEIDRIQYIFYNQEYINNLGSNKDLKWIVRFVISHEIGHHILAHTRPDSSKKPAARRKAEIEADFFAGFVIRQFPDATLENALAALNSLDPDEYEPSNSFEENSSIYPLLEKRKQAVFEGFNDIDSLKIGMFDNIKEIALASLKEYGRSSIYRTLDNLISIGNLLEANELLNEILNPVIDIQIFEEQDEMLKDRLYLRELQTELKKEIKLSETQKVMPESFEINQNDMNKILEIYKKYQTDPSIFNKNQSESLKQTLKQLQNIEIRNN